MLAQLIDVNACYQYKGQIEGLYGEHGVVVGFAMSSRPLVLFITYNATLDRASVYHAYPFELEPIEHECHCETCATAAYGLIRHAKEMLADKGIRYYETLEQVTFEMEA